MKVVRNLALSLLFCVASAVRLDAQSYPLPGSRAEAPVPCTGCTGVNSFGQPNAGLPTFPYSAPIVDHVGRYVDSQLTANFQHVGIRTIRARSMRTFPQANGSAPPRIYIQMGNAVGGYSLSTFFTSTLPGGLKSVREVARGVDRWGAPLEKLAVWDGYVYPEATESGWYAPLVDQQDPLGKGGAFDVDDRGYVYSTYPTFGWGIARDDGRTNAGHFPKTVQMVGCYSIGVPTGTVCPATLEVDGEDVPYISPSTYPNTRHDASGVLGDGILVVRTGSSYFAIVAGQTNTHAVFDVTDPASPQHVATRGGSDKGIRRYDRSDTAARVAYVDGSRKLQVYSYAGLATGAGPIATYSSVNGGFFDVAIDDTGNIWAIESTRLLKLTPAGSSYVPTDYTPFGSGFSSMQAIAVGSGHIAVMGTDFTGGARFDVRVAKIEAGGPRLIPVDNFFKNYYHSGIAGYAEPGQYVQPFDLQLVKWNTKTYLMYSAEGLGDVFEIQGGDSISLTMKTTSFGTVNPNARSTEAGPYPGDIVTFVATSSNPLVAYDVSWDFGNDESDPDNNALKKTGVDVKHQYTGLNTSAKVTTAKTVRAETIQDSTIGSQLLVNLMLPAPRIGVPGLTNPITASSTTPVDVVAGGNFTDASDGSVESHYSVWTIDGVPTKLEPNASIPIGGIGPHTLKLEAFYGKYDASFVGTAPYAAPAITIPYVVKPFRARLNAPTTVSTDVRFTATPEWTSDTSILSATTWTVTWALSGTSAGSVSTNAVVPPLTGTYNVGVIPPYDVPKADVTSGSTVSLEIVVDPSGLSVPAQAYGEAEASSLLTTPDPQIQQTGCANAGAPCTFTAKSIGGGSISDWTILWTVKQGTSTVATSVLNPYSPTLPQGSYTVTLKAKKTVFEQEVNQSVTVQQSLCGPLPAATQVTINPIGCLSSCAPGTSIKFTPSFFGYSKQTCDTFSWTFGDGTSGTGLEATHSYSSPGTKTVTLKITNTNGQVTKTRDVIITGDPPPPPCTSPTGINITYSGCTSPTSCRTTDSIRFTALRGTSSLATCDNVSWNFGDNTSSGTKSPSHSFSTPGTYTVTAVVANTSGTSSPATRQITIVTGSGGCTLAPGPGNFSITYAGPSSGCTVGNAASCTVGEVVAFTANNFFYTPASCDSYAWVFGDGQTANVRNPTHTFAANGTYDVHLTVSNNAGNFMYTRGVTVVGGAPAKEIPVITLTTFPSTGKTGTAVTFTATSSLATTTGWKWTFGSSVNTSQASIVSQTSTISHTFTNAGTFTVKAEARNSDDVPSAPMGSAQGQIVVTVPPAIPEFRYLLPVTAHTAGQGGSAWRTDVQIYNPDPQVSESKPLIMEAEFKGKTYTLEMIKSTHIYEDFLGTLLSQQKDDSGPVIITTKSAMTPPQIWTRTYTQTDHGTFGQFIPAIRLDTAGAGGAAGDVKYYLAGLRHDNRYRTNVGFLNPNSSVINATITVYDDRHLGLAQFTRTLQPFQLDQFTLKTLVPNLPADRPFSIQIEVPPGKWLVGYASNIDGFSNDPVFIQAVRADDLASPDFKNNVIPGVGHFGQWRSDVTIFNPDSDAVSSTSFTTTQPETKRRRLWASCSIRSSSCSTTTSSSRAFWAARRTASGC